MQESSEQEGDVDPYQQEEENNGLNDSVEQEQLQQDPMEQDQQVKSCSSTVEQHQYNDDVVHVLV